MVLSVSAGSFGGSSLVSSASESSASSDLPSEVAVGRQGAPDPGDQVRRVPGLAGLQVHDLGAAQSGVVRCQAVLFTHTLERVGGVGHRRIPVEVCGTADQGTYSQPEPGARVVGFDPAHVAQCAQQAVQTGAGEAGLQVQLGQGGPGVVAAEGLQQLDRAAGRLDARPVVHRAGRVRWWWTGP